MTRDSNGDSNTRSGSYLRVAASISNAGGQKNNVSALRQGSATAVQCMALPMPVWADTQQRTWPAAQAACQSWAAHHAVGSVGDQTCDHSSFPSAGAPCTCGVSLGQSVPHMLSYDDSNNIKALDIHTAAGSTA
jgi:hypothetical protein